MTDEPEKQDTAPTALPPLEETVTELRKLLEAAEKERSEYLESLKRAKNDFLKYKQDESRRAQDMVLFSNQSLIVTLLPVLDSFDLALTMIPGDAEIKKGFDLIRVQFETALRNFGLETIRPEPLKDRAITEIHETVNKKMCDVSGCKGDDEGLIVEVIANGYRLNGKLVRPAKVKVVTH